MAVPLFDTRHPAGARCRTRSSSRVDEVIAGGAFILGPEVEAFEQEFAAYLGVGHVIGVGNGTDALTIALRALGVEPGRRGRGPVTDVLRHAPRRSPQCGARPVFCDVDPDTRNVTVDTVRAALTPNTTRDHRRRPVRGPGADVPSDARARAAGARGCRPGGRRQLDGAARARSATPPRSRSIRPRTSAPSATAARSRPTTTSRRARAGAALPRLARQADASSTSATTRAWTRSRRRSCACCCAQLDDWCRRPPRRRAAPTSTPGLGDHVTAPVAPDGAEPAWHLYVVTHPRADALLRRSTSAGVQARAYYRTPLHRQPAMAPY